MKSKLNKDHLRDLLYRCRFTEVVRLISSNDVSAEDLELYFLKANALFELHRMDEVKELLGNLLKKISGGSDSGCLYVRARLAYVNEDYREAETLFLRLLETGQDPRSRFRGLLGLANVMLSEERFTKIPGLIAEMEGLRDRVTDDEWLSLLILQGNYYSASGGSSEKTKFYFKQVIRKASDRMWTYFISRALLSMACLAKRDGNLAEAKTLLEVLSSMIDESQCLYLVHLINRKLGECNLTLNTPIEFDTVGERIRIRDEWFSLNGKALLFQFLHLLHSKGTHVSKEEVVRKLWSDEDYNPPIHDPRVFDLAQRARKIIEKNENQPIILLSGRMGYKLAVRAEE